MNFTERQVEHPGKKKLIKVDANNVPIANEPEILVNIERDEGDVYVTGTQIDAANLNKGNWRDDNSLSFNKRNDNNLPSAKANETQIVTKSNGETWLIPPIGRVATPILVEIDKVHGTNGRENLSNGLIIQWGRNTVSSGQVNNVTFSPAFTTLYSVVATWCNAGNDSTKEWNIRSYNNSGFSLRHNSNHSDTHSTFWIAIGI